MVNRHGKETKEKPKLLLTVEELARIRKLNKRRAKDMEKEVCKYLGASRTPMSGAGFVKGDGILYLPNDQGIAVIECKVSSALHSTYGADISIQTKWIEKLISDTSALKGLGARFGFIVLRWHTWRERAVLIPTMYLPIIEKLLDVTIPRNDTIVSGYTKIGKPMAGIHFFRIKFKDRIGSTLTTAKGDCYITTLEQLKEWIDNVQNI